MTPEQKQQKSIELLNKYKNLNFVQRALNPTLKIQDPKNKDSYMTHKMAYAEADGQYYAYPEVIQVRNTLKHLPRDKAMKYAFETKQFIPLGADKDFAEYFTTIGYKYKFPKEGEINNKFNKNKYIIDKEVIENMKSLINGFDKQTFYMNTIKNLVQRYKNGGKPKIYIKPENKGKFTEYCGGKVTAECIARGKRSPNPTIRKRATFAANARKWKHTSKGQQGMSIPNNKVEKTIGPVFNLYTKKWTVNGKPLKEIYQKDWGVTKYTDDGFAVNYNKNNIEIGRKKGTRLPYIGAGNRTKDNQIYWDKDRELRDSTIVIANRYNIPVDVLASRISKEGVIDRAIREYNESGGKKLLSKYPSEVDSFDSWGLDTSYDDVKGKQIKILEPWIDTKEYVSRINEKDQLVNALSNLKWNDAISVTAAILKSRRDAIKRANPNLSEEELDAAAAAAFNLGTSKANKFIKTKGTEFLSAYKPHIKL